MKSGLAAFGILCTARDGTSARGSSLAAERYGGHRVPPDAGPAARNEVSYDTSQEAVAAGEGYRVHTCRTARRDWHHRAADFDPPAGAGAGQAASEFGVLPIKPSRDRPADPDVLEL